MVCRILRSAGLIGEITATWRITPSDTAVFTTTSTTVVFADGESEVVVTVQVNTRIAQFFLYLLYFFAAL